MLSSGLIMFNKYIIGSLDFRKSLAIGALPKDYLYQATC